MNLSGTEPDLKKKIGGVGGVGWCGGGGGGVSAFYFF